MAKLLSKYNTITEALGFNLTAAQAKKFGFTPTKRNIDIIETNAAMFNYDITTSTVASYSMNGSVWTYVDYDATHSYFAKEFDDLQHEGLFQGLVNQFNSNGSATQLPACTLSGRKITGTSTSQPNADRFVYKNNSLVPAGVWEQLKSNQQQWIGDWGKTTPYGNSATSYTHAFLDQRNEILKTVTDANNVVTTFKDFKWLTKNKRIFLWSNVTDGSLAKAGEWIPHYSLFFIAQTEDIRTRLKAELDTLKDNCTKTIVEYDALMMKITGATSVTQNIFYNGVLLGYRGPGSIIYIFPPTTGIHTAFCPDDGLTAYPLDEHGYIDYDSIVYGTTYTRALGAAGVNPNILDKVEGCYYIDCNAYNEPELPAIPTTVTIDQYDYSENDNLGVLTITLGQDVDEEGVVYEHRLFREPWCATPPNADLTFSNRQESTTTVEYVNSEGVSTQIIRPVITYDVSFTTVGVDHVDENCGIVMVDVEKPITGGFDNYSFKLNFITINARIKVVPPEFSCTPSTIPQVSGTITYEHWTTFTTEQLAGFSIMNAEGTAFDVQAIFNFITTNFITVTLPTIEDTYKKIEYSMDPLDFVFGTTVNRRGETVHYFTVKYQGVTDPTYADTNTALQGTHIWAYTAVGSPDVAIPKAEATLTVNIQSTQINNNDEIFEATISPNTGQWDGAGTYDENFDYSTTCPTQNIYIYDEHNEFLGENLYINGTNNIWFTKDIDGVFFADLTTSAGIVLLAEPITQGQAQYTTQIKFTVMPSYLLIEKHKDELFNKDVISILAAQTQEENKYTLLTIKKRVESVYNTLNADMTNCGLKPSSYPNQYTIMYALKKGEWKGADFGDGKQYEIIGGSLSVCDISLSFNNEATIVIDVTEGIRNFDLSALPNGNGVDYFNSIYYCPIISSAGSIVYDWKLNYDGKNMSYDFYPYQKGSSSYKTINSGGTPVNSGILAFFDTSLNNWGYTNLSKRGIKIFQTSNSRRKIVCITTSETRENDGYIYEYFRKSETEFFQSIDIDYFSSREKITDTSSTTLFSELRQKIIQLNDNNDGYTYYLYNWLTHELLSIIHLLYMATHSYLTLAQPIRQKGFYDETDPIYNSNYSPFVGLIDNITFSGSKITLKNIYGVEQFEFDMPNVPLSDTLNQTVNQSSFSERFNTTFPFLNYKRGGWHNFYHYLKGAGGVTRLSSDTINLLCSNIADNNIPLYLDYYFSYSGITFKKNNSSRENDYYTDKNIGYYNTAIVLPQNSNFKIDTNQDFVAPTDGHVFKHRIGVNTYFNSNNELCMTFPTSSADTSFTNTDYPCMHIYADGVPIYSVVLYPTVPISMPYKLDPTSTQSLYSIGFVDSISLLNGCTVLAKSVRGI